MTQEGYPVKLCCALLGLSSSVRKSRESLGSREVMSIRKLNLIIKGLPSDHQA